MRPKGTKSEKTRQIISRSDGTRFKVRNYGSRFWNIASRRPASSFTSDSVGVLFQWSEVVSEWGVSKNKNRLTITLCDLTLMKLATRRIFSSTISARCTWQRNGARTTWWRYCWKTRRKSTLRPGTAWHHCTALRDQDMSKWSARSSRIRRRSARAQR